MVDRAVNTVPLNYNFIFYTHGHAWCHAVFRVLIAKVCCGIYISMKRNVALPPVVFTRDVEFTCDVELTRDGNVTFSQDVVVLTILSNELFAITRS